MFAVFGQAGRANRSKDVKCGARAGRMSEDEEELVLQRLAVLRETLPHRHRASVVEKVLGPGTGLAYIQGPTVKCASRGGVTVLFSGQLEPSKEGEHIPEWGRERVECASNWQTETHVAAKDGGGPIWDDAKRVLDLYKKADWGGLQGLDLWEGRGGFACPAKYAWGSPRAAPKLLGSLRGRFAFTVWDSVNRRLVAARDHQAREAMFWGAPTFGDGLLFSSDRALVEEEAADADQFPPGTFFCLTPDDGTDGTGIMSSFDTAARTQEDTLLLGSDDREALTNDLEDTSSAASGEGDDNLEWESGDAPLTPRKRRGSPLRETRLAALKRSTNEAMSDEESSSEEDRASSCSPASASGPASRLPGSRLKPPAAKRPAPSVAAPRTPARSPGKPKGGSPVLRVVLRRREKTPPPTVVTSPVSPRTAVRRVVSSVMKRVQSAEGMCRVSSGENLAALAGAQIPAK